MAGKARTPPHVAVRSGGRPLTSAGRASRGAAARRSVGGSPTAGVEGTGGVAARTPGPLTASLSCARVERLTGMSGFVRVLVLVSAGGLVLRLFAVAVAGRELVGDGVIFHGQSNFIAEGSGFVDAAKLGFTFVARPSAQHPPLFVLFLSPVSWLGFKSVLAHQLTSAVLSAAAVPLLGLAAREVAGRRAGLVAAGIAAVYPNMWASDAWVMSESLYVSTIALCLLLLYRLWRAPNFGRVVWAGVAIALAALTRPEAILLLPLVLAPMCWRLQGLARRRRVELIAVGVAVVAAVTSPWVIRNLTTFENPIFLSQNFDSVVGGANCDKTYDGDALGSWEFFCNVEDLPQGDESVEGAELRRRGIRYAREHLSDVPVVVSARIGRAWEVYRPFQGIADTRHGWLRWAAVLSFWGMLVLAVPGALALRRRGVSLLPLLVQPALVTFVAAIGYGLWRLRLPLDVAAIVLASVTLARLVGRRAGGAGHAARDGVALQDVAAGQDVAT